MSKPKKDRIDTAPNPGALNNALAGLNLTGLRPGPVAPQQEPAKGPAPAKLGRVVLRREKAHRGGKTVIVVHDFAPYLSATFIEELSRRLRKAVGCGGTCRDRMIEIQGDQPDRIRALLEAEGFRVAGVK
jgi:translation initiation factor 1